MFREFIMDEVVKAIDAMSREQAIAVVQSLGLGGARFPLLVPGAKTMSLPFAPSLTEEDRRVVENVSKIVNFLSRGQGVGALLGPRGMGSAEGAAVVSELMPVLPSVATEIVPQILQRLASRVAARTVREIFV